MNIVKSTSSFESWLGQRTSIVKADLKFKHQQMAASAFPFLRSTFYRWLQVWPEVCQDLKKCPKILAVGDLHVENFGTWRDAEGRLVWGVNDFDEAYWLPFSVDLVRVVVSALLAIREKDLSLNPKQVAPAVLEGYTNALKEGGRPFLLAEEHAWLRDIAQSKFRDPVNFWQQLRVLPAVGDDLPLSAWDALNSSMPAPNLKFRILARRAGLGSLGHERFVGLLQWQGGWAARECKALVPSSAYWVAGKTGLMEIFYQVLLNQAVRCPDPFLRLRGQWIVRRLSSQCSKVRLDAMSASRQQLKLLYSMGWETANIHLGNPRAAAAISAYLKKSRANWLQKAAEAMEQATIRDWKDWKKSGAGK